MNRYCFRLIESRREMALNSPSLTGTCNFPTGLNFRVALTILVRVRGKGFIYVEKVMNHLLPESSLSARRCIELLLTLQPSAFSLCDPLTLHSFKTITFRSTGTSLSCHKSCHVERCFSWVNRALSLDCCRGDVHTKDLRSNRESHASFFPYHGGRLISTDYQRSMVSNVEDMTMSHW